MAQTISEAYRQQQMTLHRDPDYGMASTTFAKTIKNLMGAIGAKSLSDYGAGKQRLREALLAEGAGEFEYFAYDPAFPAYGKPKSADLVVCLDVLEHIEEPFLENVLLDLKAITTNVGMFSIHCGPARKLLSDGRNAHLIQAPNSWWLLQLSRHFEVVQLQGAPGGFWVAVQPLKERTA